MSNEIQLESVIERVGVYRSQALVTRRARVPLEGRTGRVSCRLRDLPLALRDDSLRLDLAEASGVRVVDVHVGWSLGRRDLALRTEAEERLRELARERLELEVERERTRARIAFIESLVPNVPPATEMPEALAFGERHQIAAWLELAAFVREQRLTARERVRALERKRRDLLDLLAEAKDELDRQSQAELEALAFCRKTARIRLELDRAQDAVDLFMSYLVPGARWVPEYELRVFEERDEAELVLKALVAQRTGEDWDRAELAFSTADLRRSTALPELDSWRIGKRQPPKTTGWRPLPEGLDELFEAYDAGVRSLPAPQLPALPKLPKTPRLGAAEPAAEPRREVQKTARMLAERVQAMAAPAPPPPPQRQAPPESAAYEPHEALDDAVMARLGVDEEAERAWQDAAPAPAAPLEAPRRRSAPKRAKRRDWKEQEAPAGPVGGGVEVAAYGAGGTMLVSKAEAEAEPHAAALGASQQALGYQELRMHGPRERGLRGQLKAAALADRLVDSVPDAADEVVAAVREVPEATLSKALAPTGAGLGELALPRYAVAVAESAGHFAARYKMETPGSVPADGQLHALTLLRREGKARRVFRCVPLLDDSVYQLAEFENPLEVPLLAGPVRAYRGGDYVVTGPLETTPPGKLLTVNLGVEPGIVVARNVHFHESTEGLFGGETNLEHTVEIEVRSKLDRPAPVEIFERVPYSSDDDIKVEVIRTVPEAEPYDQTERGQRLRGGWRFAFELPPRQTLTCALVYRITIPSKQVLVGGNRRD